MTPEQRLADTFVALAGSTRDGAPDIPGTLSLLAHRTPPLLGVRAATVVFVPGEREETRVYGSNPEVSRLERDSVGRHEGPGHDFRHADEHPIQAALDSRPTVLRWPHYTSRAVELGYTHAAALPLRGHTRTSGALVLLSGPGSDFSPRTLQLGQSVADFTAVILESAYEAERSRTLTAQLEQALTSRVIIEQAKGVLATQRSLTMGDAFNLLRRHARSHQRLLSDVAREVVEGRPDPELANPKAQ
ncbi:GAF and ANTAR domain-containing protein [Streptomyces sp. NBC_01304]|uniref:GAF and ANTAR domain-containing protein n=1 Tax=Streptomyces sp. NBC_01304 TaxID=2903818 RepID=UPI002E15584B|nr:GAF and ANTAR domain-containing protein [Streptomyces sp. NBC_01304]